MSVDAESRLLTQEERCRALEQQLENTRVMVHQAERDRAEALRQMAALRIDKVHVENTERRAYVEKISDLEREQLRLMATQTLAQVAKHAVLPLLFLLVLSIGFKQWVTDMMHHVS